jgi:phosphatidylserine decarboxylase
MSIAREGWPYIASLLGLAALLAAARLPWLAGLCAGLTVFTLFFFRDPERPVPQDPRLVLSPADGRVVKLAQAPEANPLGPGAWQVSIFLSVLDVHVNRAPIGGRIARVDYTRGEFLPAFDDKASLRNEQNSVLVERDGARVAFKQIAGLIARRIVGFTRAGATVGAGERIGMIRFGSRVDVYLPEGTRPLVAEGQTAIAGETILAELRGVARELTFRVG